MADIKFKSKSDVLIKTLDATVKTADRTVKGVGETGKTLNRAADGVDPSAGLGELMQSAETRTSISITNHIKVQNA